MSVAAQGTTGGIRGIVRDETGAVLVGVTVEGESPSRIGPPAVSVTNQQGLYRFEDLPVGFYTVRFALMGFATVKRENVRVELGRSTQLDMTLTVAGTEETITVTAASPVIDTVHATYTTNFNQEMVTNVPTTRNSYYDVIQAVPGVQGGATFTYFGSNSDQNAYRINGIDVSAPDYGRAWAWPNYDIIQEIEVLGVGAAAEFSEFQGGVVNVITKSGSNDWRGVGTAFWVDDWMLGNNSPEEEFPPQIDYFTDLTFQLGGPILKDRLWVIGLAQSWRRRQVPVGVELTPEVEPCNEFRTFVKANAQLTDRDTLAVHYDNNNFRCANPPTRTEPLETTSTEHGDNPVISVRWTRAFSANTILDVNGGGIYIDSRLDPTLENYDDSSHFDFATGLSSVNSFGTWKSHQNKTQVAAAITHYADDFLGGSHDFKFGTQLSFASALSSQSYFNNRLYYDYAGPYYVYQREPYNIGGEINTTGVFAQDNWTISDRLTANLGVRFDHTSGSIPETDQLDQKLEDPTGVVYPGVPDVIQFDHVSPRLGLNFVLDRSGKTVAKASYGRYYGKLITNMFDNLSPGNTSVEALLFNPDSGEFDIPFYDVNFNSNFDVDDNLRNQYTDQFMVGVERQLAPDFGLQAMFVYKTEDDFIRVEDVRSTFEPLPYEDTFEGETQTLTVFDRVSPASEALYLVTNRDDFDQSYKSFILQANKRWSGSWQLNGSYEWQRGVGYSGVQAGRFPGALQNAGSLNQNSFGADPNDLTNAYGRLPSDSTHIMKVTSTYEAPWGIHAAVRLRFEQGRPYGRAINVRGLSQGRREVLAEPRGEYQLDNIYDVGIRLDKDFSFGENKRLRLSLDIFNLLNSDAVTAVPNNSSQENFGVPTAIVFPRQAMVGVRFEFW